MGVRKLHIHLDDEGPRHAGQCIAGHVSVTADDAVDVNGGKLRLFYRARGWGDESVGGEVEVVLPVFSVEAGGTHEERFELPCPEAPLSAEGTLFRVDWILAAEIDVPWALDPKAERVVQVVAAPREALGETVGDYRRSWKATRPLVKVATGARSSLYVGVGLLAMFGLFAFLRALDEQEGHAPKSVGGDLLLFGVVAAFVLGRSVLPSVRSGIARRKLGTPQIELPEEAYLGDVIPIAVEVTPRAALDVREVAVTLRCTEKATKRSGKNRQTKEHLAHVERRVIAAGESIPAGASRRWTGTIQIPTGKLPSLAVDSNDVVWEAVVQIDLPGWPDEIEAYPLRVLG